jgi:hypothetical protein
MSSLINGLYRFGEFTLNERGAAPDPEGLRHPALSRSERGKDGHQRRTDAGGLAGQFHGRIQPDANDFHGAKSPG